MSDKDSEKSPSRDADTRDAVETSIELAKSHKKGTWEGITRTKRKKTTRWEYITQDGFEEALEKASRPEVPPPDEETSET